MNGENHPKMKSLRIVFLFALFAKCSFACAPSLTTASGTHAPHSFCSGDLIFKDNFNKLNLSKWRHEVTLAGGGNFEFQWYVNDRFNSYTTRGILHIKPSFTSDIFGEAFLTTGQVNIEPSECTDSNNYGCYRQGTSDHIINPIRSARVDTMNSFSFKYGTIEFRAKMPAGDWLWPAIWMMPRHSVYGQWPSSGEIDIMEMRGNRQLFADGGHVGNQHASSTLHFGPSASVKNQWPLAHLSANRQKGFDDKFHVYKMFWSPTEIRFSIDNVLIETINPGNGFWDYGNFASSDCQNPWYSDGTEMAPFDQEFFIIMNLAVGGTIFFADSFVNQPYPKPWLNTSPRAAADFWEQRDQWDPTWHRNHSNDSHFQVDYVRVWAL